MLWYMSGRIFYQNLDISMWSNQPLPPEIQGTHMHRCVHTLMQTHTGPWCPGSHVQWVAKKPGPQGLSQSRRDAQSPRYSHRGSWPVVWWLRRHPLQSQVAGYFPDDLQGYGGAGELGHGVGQRVGGCPQLPQVGHDVHHAVQEEDKEVHAGRSSPIN